MPNYILALTHYSLVSTGRQESHHSQGSAGVSGETEMSSAIEGRGPDESPVIRFQCKALFQASCNYIKLLRVDYL